jgi:hypothetical protein
VLFVSKSIKIFQLTIFQPNVLTFMIIGTQCCRSYFHKLWLPTIHGWMFSLWCLFQVTPSVNNWSTCIPPYERVEKTTKIIEPCLWICLYFNNKNGIQIKCNCITWNIPFFFLFFFLACNNLIISIRDIGWSYQGHWQKWNLILFSICWVSKITSKNQKERKPPIYLFIV